MSVALISSLSPVVVAVNGGSSIVIPTESFGLPLNIQQSLSHHSGNIFPTMVTVSGSNPRMILSVPIDVALSVFGLGLVKLTTCDAYLARFSDYNKTTGATHFKIGLETGCAASAEITSWAASVDGVVMAAVEIVFLSTTGALNPVKFTDSQTLPSLASMPKLHTLGPVAVNGTIIPGLSASNGAINGSPFVPRHDGDLFPRTCARIQAQPSMDLSHSDPISVLTALGGLGAAITANVSAYLKGYDPATGVTSQTGIEIRVANGRISPSGADASQGAVSTTSLHVAAISGDGATAAMQFSQNITVPSMT